MRWPPCTVLRGDLLRLANVSTRTIKDLMAQTGARRVRGQSANSTRATCRKGKVWLCPVRRRQSLLEHDVHGNPCCR